jgi:hypothetical protein
MKSTPSRIATAVAALLLGAGAAHAASYRQTIASYKNASQSADFFENSYAYAVFPTVGKGSFIVGGAHGDGRVYAHGVPVGTTAVTQLSVGFQAGGEAYSDGQNNASVSGTYNNGMVVFTIVKGGLEGGASVAGEKFTYHAKT